MINLDIKDRKIIAELDLDARMPISKLAKKVGLSRQNTKYRFERLIRKEILFGAKAVFDTGKINYAWYRVLIRFTNVDNEEKEKLIQYIINKNNVIWLGEVGGKWDIAVNFVSKNNYEFDNFFQTLNEEYSSYIEEYMILPYVDLSDYPRRYIFDNNQDKKFHHSFQYNPEIKLDSLDYKIIEKISEDSLVSNLELGKELSVSPNTIKNRINIMKKNKLLLGFRLFVNPRVVGYSSHFLFLETNHNDKFQEQKLLDYLDALPEIIFLVKHLSNWRIALEIETENEIKFQNILVEIRSKFSNIIKNIETMPIFKDREINYFPKSIYEKNLL
jgi:Lrp/AsnC family transcriptional regulator, leucine-responsive regulatory protein